MKGKAYPGVFIAIRGREFRVNRELDAVRFRLDPRIDEIVIEPIAAKKKSKRRREE